MSSFGAGKWLSELFVSRYQTLAHGGGSGTETMLTTSCACKGSIILKRVVCVVPPAVST